MIVIIKEIGMNVHRVDRIKFSDIDQVKALYLISLDLDRLFHISKGDAVGSINLIISIKVRVETVHHHHHFVVIFAFWELVISLASDLFIFSPGCLARVRIDHESAVQSFMNVAF